MVLSFDHFTVNTETYELHADGEICQVEPMVFDLIAHFATYPERLFSRDDLIESVWKGRLVSDATVAACVKNARKVLGDTGDAQTYIQTVRGRGYRFSATVSRTDAEHLQDSSPVVAPSAQSSASQPVLVEADPALLILPFRCRSDDPDVQHIADSLAIDLSTILTRIPLLRLSAQGDHFQTWPTQPTARQIHEELGVDFVLDSYLQSIGEQVRVNIQLSNARTGYRLWADVFELTGRSAEALDACVNTIISKLEPQLHRAMYDLVRSANTQPTARQLFLEASGLLVMQGWHHQSVAQASPILRHSSQLDPGFALAPSLLSMLVGFGTRLGLSSDPERARAEALAAAEHALQLDSMDSTILGLSGCGLADIGFLERGESLLRNAIDLNAANAQAWVALGAVRIAQNDIDDAVAKLSKGIQISPMDSRLSVWGALLAVALLMSGDIDRACQAAETACHRNDRTYLPRLALAGARVVQNDSQAALGALAEARRIKPDLTSRQIGALIGSKLRNHLLALENIAANHQ